MACRGLRPTTGHALGLPNDDDDDDDDDDDIYLLVYLDPSNLNIYIREREGRISVQEEAGYKMCTGVR